MGSHVNASNKPFDIVGSITNRDPHHPLRIFIDPQIQKGYTHVRQIEKARVRAAIPGEREKAVCWLLKMGRPLGILGGEGVVMFVCMYADCKGSSGSALR